MIKKLLTTALAFSAFATFAQSGLVSQPATLENPVKLYGPAVQNKSAVVANANDTLFYFFNKHYYRNGSLGGFFVYASAPSATAQPLVFGSSFLTNSTNSLVTVNGAIALLSRRASAPSASVSVKMYLYNASATGVPTTKLDSATSVVTGTNPSYVMFNLAAPKLVTGNFCIAYRNNSVNNLDTIRAWSNNAAAPSSTLPAAQKYGEGLGYVGLTGTYGGSLTPMAAALGGGTDREFIVMPMVSFSLQSAHISQSVTCPAVTTNYTNTSVPASLLENRQFNFNKFAPAWAPYTTSITPIGGTDSIYTWNYTGATPVQQKKKNGNPIFNAAGSGSATLTVKYLLGADNGMSYTDVSTSSLVVSTCTGIDKNAVNSNILIYPNPTVNGKTAVNGLEGTNTIIVYNVLGQAVLTQTTDKETVSIDLSNQNSGNYFIRITNSNNQTKTVKVINH